MNAFTQWAAPCLAVIKSTIQVKKLKNSYNYSSQHSWKSKSCCSSTYWVQAIDFRPLIGSIMARGINNMIFSLSGTHILNDQKVLLLRKITAQKNNTSTWKRAAKASCGSRRQLPQEEWPPLHLVDEFLVRWKEKKWRTKKKNLSPITVTLKRFGSSLDSVCEGTFEWSSGRKGESELLILITQACDSLLSCVTDLLSVLSL